MKNKAIIIDLTTYTQGLDIHTIDKIEVNGKRYKVTEFSYLGDLSQMPSGYHYQILEGKKVKLFPVNPEDTIRVAVVFQPERSATTLPVALLKYKDALISGLIAKLRTMKGYEKDDMAYHKAMYENAIQEATGNWHKNTGSSRKAVRFI